MKTKLWIYLMVMGNVVLAQDLDYGPQTIENAHSVAGVSAVVADLEEYAIPTAYLLDLTDAKKLPFDLYSWPIDMATLNQRNFRFLVEYVRITGSLGVNEFIPDDKLLLLMQIITEAKGKLVLHSSPYHRFHCDGDPTQWGRTGRDLQLLQDYLTRFKDMPVAAIVFDSECYGTPHPNVTARLNLVYAMAKGVYPNTPFYWYRNGDWLPNTEADHENRTVVWYRPYNYQYTEGWLLRWKEKIPYDGYWTVWISLGSGYGWPAFSGWKWDLGLNSLYYEFLGRECHELGGPVIMYPGPYRSYCPSFHQAFMAFIRGATETVGQTPTNVKMP